MQLAQGLAKLTLAQIAKLDGERLAVCFAQELKRVVCDIEDRPADDRDRVITLQFTFVPESGPNDGLLDGAKMKAQVTSKLPSYRSKKYDFGVHDGNLVFQPTSPTNHLSTPLPGMEGDESDDEQS